MKQPSPPSTARPQPQQQAGRPTPIAAPVAAAVARDPRVRAAMSGLDPDQRDYVRRAIADAIEKKIGQRGGLR